MKKRILSLILALVLVLSATPSFTTFAYASDSSTFSQAMSPGNDTSQEISNEFSFDAPDNAQQDKMADSQQSTTTALNQAENAIPLMPNAQTADISLFSAGAQRYTVLVLDTSSSSDFLGSWGTVIYTACTAIEYVKASAKKFIDAVRSADGTNYVAVVTYKGSTATVVSPFSTDFSALKSSIDGLSASENIRNVAAGLQSANTLISAVSTPDAIKNVVLFTTGMTNAGDYSYSGHYDETTVGSNWRRQDTQIRLYAYANAAYSIAETLKIKSTLYTIGLFQTMEYMPSEGRVVVDFFKLSTLDWATSSNHFYDVNDPNDLEFIFGEVATDIANAKKTGTFMFPSASSKDFPATYYYDDNYFTQAASIYNPSLATMSLCFELSAWGSNVGGTYDYTNKARNARDLLDQTGFGDIETNHDFTVKPTEDSMGVVVAHKDIMDKGTPYTLIALATRGGGYEAEWAGNFTVGASGQHQGFKTARDEAYRFLSDYITRHKGSFQNNIKFWFAGYSRAGATVNLLAAKMNEDKQIAGLSLNKENLFAYCFEPPMGALQNAITPKSNYNNIHNIVNPSDLVPKVAPRAWSFARYGVDEPVIPTKLTYSGTAEHKNMLEKFKALNTDWTNESIQADGRHIIDTFQAKQIDVGVDIDWDWGHWEWVPPGSPLWFGRLVYVNNTTINPHLVKDDGKDISAFLDNLILSLAVGLESRQNYTVKLQAAARLATAEFMGGGYERYKWEKVPNIMNEKLRSHLPDIAWSFVTNGTTGVETLVTIYLFESISAAGINIGAYASVPGAIAEALNAIVRAIVASLTISNGNDLVTLGYNSNKLFAAHYPELCLAWLQMQDVNYTPDGHKLFVINAYRVVRINCPVDVDVFDASGKLVAQFINDVPQEIIDSNIVSSYTSDGEKLIYLPADQDYDIKIVATEDGVLNYSVSEFSYDTFNYAKLVNYYDIPIAKGDVLNAEIAEFLPEETTNTGEGSARVYSLSNDSGNLPPDLDITGTDAQNSVYAVTVESDSADGGTVLGGGAYTEGSFAQVSVIPYEKCEFAGWYKNEALVSEETHYRFRVDGNTNLAAKFTGSRPTPENGAYSLTIVAGTGGSISSGSNGYYSEKSVVNLSVTTDNGYRFKNWTSSGSGTFVDANNDNTTFIMPSNATTITANFEKTGSDNNGDNGNNNGNNDGNSDNNSNDNNDGTKDDNNNGSDNNNGNSDNNSNNNGNKDDKNNGNGNKDGIGSGSSNNGSGAITFTVTFETNGGSKIDNQRVIKNGKAIQPVSPTKDAFTFVGWFTDKELTLKYVFDTQVTNNLILYAKWTESFNTSEWKNPFVDVKNADWLYGDVAFVVDNGLFNGTSATTFKPNNTMTRAMLVTVLWRLEGSPSASGMPFSDVLGGQWYSDAVSWAAQNNLVNGIGDSLFAPNANITREQLATILYRYEQFSSKIPPGVAEDRSFADKNDISEMATTAVSMLVTQGIIDGKPGNLFEPKGTATRAEVAVMLHRFVKVS